MSEFEYTDINDPSSGTPAQRAAAEAIMNDALETWRDRAIKAHPGASKLREYLTAETADGVMNLAAELEGKLGNDQPEPTVPTVTGGSPALNSYDGDDNSELGQAREALRKNPNNEKLQSDWLRAKFHDAGMTYIDEN